MNGLARYRILGWQPFSFILLKTAPLSSGFQDCCWDVWWYFNSWCFIESCRMFFLSLCSKIYWWLALVWVYFYPLVGHAVGTSDLETQVFPFWKIFEIFHWLFPLFSFWNSFVRVWDSCAGPLIFLLFLSYFPQSGSPGGALLGSTFLKNLSLTHEGCR